LEQHKRVCHVYLRGLLQPLAPIAPPAALQASETVEADHEHARRAAEKEARATAKAKAAAAAAAAEAEAKVAEEALAAKAKENSEFEAAAAIEVSTNAAVTDDGKTKEEDVEEEEEQKVSIDNHFYDAEEEEGVEQVQEQEEEEKEEEGVSYKVPTRQLMRQREAAYAVMSTATKCESCTKCLNWHQEKGNLENALRHAKSEKSALEHERESLKTELQKVKNGLQTLRAESSHLGQMRLRNEMQQRVDDLEGIMLQKTEECKELRLLLQKQEQENRKKNSENDTFVRDLSQLRAQLAQEKALRQEVEARLEKRKEAVQKLKEENSLLIKRNQIQNEKLEAVGKVEEERQALEEQLEVQMQAQWMNDRAFQSLRDKCETLEETISRKEGKSNRLAIRGLSLTVPQSSKALPASQKLEQEITELFQGFFDKPPLVEVIRPRPFALVHLNQENSNWVDHKKAIIVSLNKEPILLRGKKLIVSDGTYEVEESPADFLEEMPPELVEHLEELKRRTQNSSSYAK